MMAIHIGIETPWPTVPFNDANDANFREGEQRSIDGVVRDTRKFPLDNLENGIGRRVLFRLNNLLVYGDALRRDAKMMFFACVRIEIEKFSIRFFLHIVII